MGETSPMRRIGPSSESGEASGKERAQIRISIPSKRCYHKLYENRLAAAPQPRNQEAGRSEDKAGKIRDFGPNLVY